MMERLHGRRETTRGWNQEVSSAQDMLGLVFMLAGPREGAKLASGADLAAPRPCDDIDKKHWDKSEYISPFNED